MFKTLATAALAAIVAVPAFAQTQPQPTAAELLQRGIFAQETSGDLDSAIKIYRQIADSHPQQRELGAQAQYRLGMALLAKGDTNAASQEIQRLGWDYPDFKDLIASGKNLRVTLGYHADTKTFFFSPNFPAGVRNEVLTATLVDPVQADLKKAAAHTADHEALFNFKEPATVTGTVAQIAWMNPYTVLTLINPASNGAPVRVFVASPNTLMRAGWTRETVKFGDQITVTGAPGIDGSGTFQATSVSLNGQTLFSRPNGPLPQSAMGAYEK